MSQWHAHSRAVVFHTLHRGQRDARLCPLISYRSLLCTCYGCSVPRVLLYLPSFTLLLHPLPPPLIPRQIKPPCSHQGIPTRATGALSNPSQRSNSDCVVSYRDTMFWIRLMYSSIVKNPAYSRAIAAEVYVHFPPSVLRRSRPVSCLDTWV